MRKIIKNKNLVPVTIADLNLDDFPDLNSTDPVTSRGVAEAVGGASEVLQEKIDDIAERAGSGYIPKGPASVATLNGLTGQENGWLYTMTDVGTLTDGSVAVVAGDTVAWDATNSVWYKAMDYALRQYGTNEIKNLSTSITAFRAGDVIPVDGPSGTAKMATDDLLRVTARSFPKAYAKRDAATTNRYGKLFTLSPNNISQASVGIIIAFLSRDSADNNVSGFIRISFVGTTPKAFTTILSDGNTPTPYIYNSFLLALNESNKWEVWVDLTTWSIVTAQIISEYQNYEVHTNITASTAPVGSSAIPLGLAVTKPFTGSPTGSQSIPVYAKANGSLEACTNDFVHNGTMTDDDGGEIVETPPQRVYVTGKFYFVVGKVCCCTAYSEASATFNVYGVVEAMNYILSQI